jgi:L-asparagine transporter-like permease
VPSTARDRTNFASRKKHATEGPSAMMTKIFAAFVAVALLLAYLGPMVFKMKDVALTCVVVLGIVVMLVDLWYTFRKAED